jgi:NADH dehydrogenase FAD-containing subunit
VNEHLQLAGYRNIFVAGDLTEIPEQEEKLCQTAGSEISVVIRNIYNMERQRALCKYAVAKCPMLISLGNYLSYECVFDFLIRKI